MPYDTGGIRRCQGAFEEKSLSSRQGIASVERHAVDGTPERARLHDLLWGKKTATEHYS